MDDTVYLDVPEKIAAVFGPPRGDMNYRCLYGGRGSGKSVGAALMVAVWGYAEPLRILCVREFQASIRESFHAELRAAIEMHPWLANHYDIGVDYIRGANGTEFIFRGLRRNSQSIKSLAKIDVTVVEEAEDIPEESWIALLATVFRQPKSEMIVIWNPKMENSPVDTRFRKHTPPATLIEEVNFSDNAFFPPGLEKLRQHDFETLDRDVYNHIWEGKYLKSVKGAYYADLIDTAVKEERVGFYPRHDMNKLYAVWDIGSTSTSADATTIWMVQYVGEEVRWLGYYEAVGQEMRAHVEWLRANNFGDAVCVLPHDGGRHDTVYSVTPKKFLEEAGFTVVVVPNQGKGAAMQRVYALKGIFSRCRFNEDGIGVATGIETLRFYHEKWDDKRNIGLGPEHDWSSHCADAAGLVAVFRQRQTLNTGPKRDVRRRLKGVA